MSSSEALGNGSPGKSAARPHPPGRNDHVVQFYDDEDYLCDAVANYLAEGLERGEPALVIATEARRRAIARRLRYTATPASTDPPREIEYVDALDLIRTFMVGAAPDEERFRTAVGRVLERSLGRRSDRRIRAYGEMVDVLWNEGRHAAALRVEELWNELAAAYSFSLLCAYAMSGFHRGADAEPFRRICLTHSRVVPAESYSRLEGDARDREIGRLQQRARVLETEIDRRRRLEEALRTALDERRRAEEELRRREEDLRDFFDNAVEGLHTAGPDGTILWANRAQIEMLGYAREEYLGRNVAEFHTTPEAAAEILDRLGSGETLRDYEATLRCRDGTVRHVQINSNVRWHNGEFLHTRCFMRDVTGRKVAEAALRRAKEEAEHANRVKTDFLAVMSHELRTPLNAILGYHDLLAEGVGGSVTPVQQTYLSRIAGSTRHLIDLIDQVLSLSRMEAGMEELATEPVDLCALAAETCAMIEPTVANNGLTLAIVVPDEALVVQTDAGKVRQILLNLLSNALKFTSLGSVTFRLRQERGFAVVDISDTGIGIQPADLERIFEPFVQVDSSVTRRHGGTGLGLSVSRDFAHLLGGELTAASTPGEGSTFTVRLPLDRTPDEIDVATAEALAESTRAGRSAAGTRPETRS